MILIDPYSDRGHAYECASQYEEAIAEYSRAINFGDVYSFLGRASSFAKAGEKQKAVDDYQEFLRLSQDPELVEEVKQEIEKLRLEHLL